MNSRPRASAAVLRNGGKEVLMVKHVWPNGRTYWQFPGGGASANETLEETVIRELKEETGLEGSNPQKVFELPYSKGISTTFLVDVDDNVAPVLGIDPEEENDDHQKLAAVAWMPLADHLENSEVKALLKYFEETNH